MAKSAGGAFNPKNYDYSDTVTTQTGNTYTNATLSGTTTIGSGATLTSPTLVTPIMASLVDGAAVNRAIFNQTAKTIANGSATALFDVARANGVSAGGVVFFLCVATDAGGEQQSISGMATYSHVDKAGTGTFTVTYATANEAKAVSSGTYTLAFTYVTGTAKGTFKLQPTTSLTATSHTVTYTVFPIAGAVTIL